MINDASASRPMTCNDVRTHVYILKKKRVRGVRDIIYASWETKSVYYKRKHPWSVTCMHLDAIDQAKPINYIIESRENAVDVACNCRRVKRRDNVSSCHHFNVVGHDARVLHVAFDDGRNLEARERRKLPHERKGITSAMGIQLRTVFWFAGLSLQRIASSRMHSMVYLHHASPSQEICAGRGSVLGARFSFFEGSQGEDGGVGKGELWGMREEEEAEYSQDEDTKRAKEELKIQRKCAPNLHEDCVVAGHGHHDQLLDDGHRAAVDKRDAFPEQHQNIRPLALAQQQNDQVGYQLVLRLEARVAVALENRADGCKHGPHFAFFAPKLQKPHKHVRVAEEKLLGNGVAVAHVRDDAARAVDHLALQVTREA
jgi:hypothetical protein